MGTMVGGRYQIASELATDSRRALYEAEDAELGVRVCLAIVRAEGPATPRLAAAEKLRALKHPVLATVLDVGQGEDGDLYIVTERAIGTSLRTLITGKVLEQRRALAIMRQVLEALAVAHDAGAIHGDINPDSIIVANEGNAVRVKLVEFGIATLLGAAKPGDPRYAAPEFALGSLDARSDIYSVGAVLFELLTGHPPFSADDASTLRRLHAYAPRQTLKQRALDRSFNHALEELVAMALDKKREARFQSARDMIAVLDHAVQSIEELASPPEASPQAGNDSLRLLAKDLMPAESRDASAEVAVPVNVGRLVPALPWPTRAWRWLRKTRVLAGVAVVAVAVAIAIVVTRGGSKAKPRNVSEQTSSLIRDGKANEAITLIEHELAANPAVAGEPWVVASLASLARSRDPAIAIQALDLIARWSGTQGHTILVRHASGDERMAVRHHARLLAERAGVADRIDLVASWILDLDQTTNCEQQRAVIGKLAEAADERALPSLQKAKAQKCAEQDAAAAIQRITSK